MQKVIETLLIGLSTGSIYALMSLALVLVWRSTRVINFAQAGQAMFATYLQLSQEHFLEQGLIISSCALFSSMPPQGLRQ
jgi:branched-subunit amino acid ABC-type transport system permease component